MGSGTVLGHGVANLVELGSSLGGVGLDAVVGVLTELLVLGSSLGSELGATLLGLLGDIVHLLVEGIHGIVEVLAGLLGVLLDLSSIHGNVLVGLLDAGICGLSKGSESTLLRLNGIL